MNTKRRIVIFVICSIVYLGVIAAALFFLSGCEMLAQYGSNDPNGTFVLIDPNQIDALINAGHAVQATGIAIGRPELIGLGLLIVTIGVAIRSAIIKKK